MRAPVTPSDGTAKRGEAGHECVEEHAAGAEVREPLVDVRRDHVRADQPGERPGRRVRDRPPRGAGEPLSCEHERLQDPDNEAGDGAHQHEVGSVDAVVDERRADGEADAHTDARRGDPEPRHELPQREPLRGADDGARDQAAGDRRARRSRPRRRSGSRCKPPIGKPSRAASGQAQIRGRLSAPGWVADDRVVMCFLSGVVCSAGG